MSIHEFRKLAFLTIAGLGCSLAAIQPISAGGRIVAVDPNCEDYCPPTCCQRFCRTLKLHCVYFKRSCTQKFILVPTAQPGFIPADCPTYSSPPPVSAGPPGVFIH